MDSQPLGILAMSSLSGLLCESSPVNQEEGQGGT